MSASAFRYYLRVMDAQHHSLTGIDEILIRSGSILGAIVLVALFTGAARTLVYVMPLWSFPFLALIAVAPIALLLAGFGLRLRDHRLYDLWRAVKSHGEISIQELCQITDLNQNELRQAVGLLNKKATAGLIWDSHLGTVRHIDAPTGRILSHSEDCSSCGAAVAIEIKAVSRLRDLGCPYCGGGLDAAAINGLRAQLIEDQTHDIKSPTTSSTASSAPRPTVPNPVAAKQPSPAAAHQSSTTPFNLAIFAVLLLLFWPGAVWYAMSRAKSGQIKL